MRKVGQTKRIVELAKKGETVKNIAERMGCSRTTVRKICKKYGIAANIERLLSREDMQKASCKHCGMDISY